MTVELAVVLLGEPTVVRPLVGPLSDRLGLTVSATTPEDHLEVAAGTAGAGRGVIGLSARPWPSSAELHAAASEQVPGYAGVVGWHGLPALHDHLAAAVTPGAAAGAHVLVTAPDPGREATPEQVTPEQVTFLREVAQAIAARVALPSRSVAWRGTTRTPTAVHAVATVVEAHGRTDIVECPVAPGLGHDPAVQAAAAAAGARLTCVDLGRDVLVGLLAEVVATVAANERFAPEADG